MKLKRQILGTATAGAVMLLPFAANAGAEIYGKIHLSADYMDTGAKEGHALSSNATRIGLKGKEELTDSLKAVWKIELETTFAESTFKDKDTLFKARDRIFGLETKSGTLQFGYYDTPSKSLGKKFAQFSDTVADRRGVLGYDFKEENKFDIRASDAVMYTSPSIAGLKVKLMRSAGSTAADAAPGSDVTPVTSMSAIYDKKKYYVGIAYEDQEAKRISGVRFVGGASVVGAKVNVIFEQLSSDSKKSSDRSVYGLSGSYGIGSYTLKGQALVADDYSGKSDSGAMMISGAVYKKVAKSFEVYGIVSRLENDDNAKYKLTGSGHSDSYKPSDYGANMHAASLGMIYKF